MPKLCGTDSFYGGGMVTGQPIGTMIGSRMINNAQAGFIIGKYCLYTQRASAFLFGSVIVKDFISA